MNDVRKTEKESHHNKYINLPYALVYGRLGRLGRLEYRMTRFAGRPRVRLGSLALRKGLPADWDLLL